MNCKGDTSTIRHTKRHWMVHNFIYNVKYVLALRTEYWQYTLRWCALGLQQPHHFIKSLVITSTNLIAINSWQLLELGLDLFTHFLNFIHAFSGVYKLRTYHSIRERPKKNPQNRRNINKFIFCWYWLGHLICPRRVQGLNSKASLLTRTLSINLQFLKIISSKVKIPEWTKRWGDVAGWWGWAGGAHLIPLVGLTILNPIMYQLRLKLRGVFKTCIKF